VIRTKLCDLLGIEHPIIQGGMAWIATAELTAAVSEAGGLGVIGASGGSAPGSWVRDQIRRVRERTSRPFGVNILLISPYADDVFRVALEERVPAVTTGAGAPSAYVPALKDAGIRVIPVVSSVALARRLARHTQCAARGADAFVAEGMESGGHIGDVSTMPLVPQVVDAVGVPVALPTGAAWRRRWPWAQPASRWAHGSSAPPSASPTRRSSTRWWRPGTGPLSPPATAWVTPSSALPIDEKGTGRRPRPAQPHDP